MGEARNSVNLIQLGMRQQNRRDSLKGGTCQLTSRAETWALLTEKSGCLAGFECI